MAEDPNILLDKLVNDLKPVAPLRQHIGMGWALLAICAASLSVIILLGIRHDVLAARPNPMFLMSNGLFLVLALATSWAAVDMARPYVSTRRDGWGWTALMAAVLPAAALFQMGGEFLHGQPIALEIDGIACLIVGSIASLFTFAALTLWLKRGAPSSPKRAGLLTGVAAGAAGIFAVSLYCPNNDLSHIGIWHGATIILMGLAGRIFLPKYLNW